MKATDRQEGGDHYKKYEIQPAEFFAKNKIPWCEANVCKYAIRHADKNGIEDIRKAYHYLDLLREFHYPHDLLREGQPHNVNLAENQFIISELSDLRERWMKRYENTQEPARDLKQCINELKELIESIDMVSPKPVDWADPDEARKHVGGH